MPLILSKIAFFTLLLTGAQSYGFLDIYNTNCFKNMV